MVRKWLRKLILWALGGDAEPQEQFIRQVFSEWLNGPED